MENSGFKITSIRHYFYIMLAVVLCGGCYPVEVHETINRTKHINIETKVIVKQLSETDNFSIITIDSCEYIIYKEKDMAGSHGGAGFGGMCHKHNCKYCKERALANYR